MDAPDAERALPAYEGFIFTHSLRLVGIIEEDFDDIQQMYRIKAWKSLLAFNPLRSGTLVIGGRTPEQSFVYRCLKNQEKDMLKKRRRRDVHIEDFAPSSHVRFESRYLSVDHDQAFGAVEDAVLVPNTLTDVEVRVVCLLYAAYRQSEVAGKLGLARREMELLMRSVREKLADWRPTPQTAQLIEFPVAGSSPGRDPALQGETPIAA